MSLFPLMCLIMYILDTLGIFITNTVSNNMLEFCFGDCTRSKLLPFSLLAHLSNLMT